MNFKDVVIASVKGIDYRIDFWYMSKNDAINMMENFNLDKKVDYYKKILLYIKMGETTYHKEKQQQQRNNSK